MLLHCITSVANTGHSKASYIVQCTIHIVLNIGITSFLLYQNACFRDLVLILSKLFFCTNYYKKYLSYIPSLYRLLTQYCHFLHHSCKHFFPYPIHILHQCYNIMTVPPDQHTFWQQLIFFLIF